MLGQMETELWYNNRISDQNKRICLSKGTSVVKYMEEHQSKLSTIERNRLNGMIFANKLKHFRKKLYVAEKTARNSTPSRTAYVKLSNKIHHSRSMPAIGLELVVFHLDYANGLVVGLPELGMRQLQRIQTLAAKLVLDEQFNFNYNK